MTAGCTASMFAFGGQRSGRTAEAGSTAHQASERQRCEVQALVRSTKKFGKVTQSACCARLVQNGNPPRPSNKAIVANTLMLRCTADSAHGSRKSHYSTGGQILDGLAVCRPGIISSRCRFMMLPLTRNKLTSTCRTSAANSACTLEQSQAQPHCASSAPVCHDCRKQYAMLSMPHEFMCCVCVSSAPAAAPAPPHDPGGRGRHSAPPTAGAMMLRCK